jgi:putative acetyltransferase
VPPRQTAPVHDLVIGTDDPATPDVRALLDHHLAFARRHSPPEDVHALDTEGLRADGVTFFSIRSAGTGGELLGVGALRHLDADHVEIKSMHTAEAARGRGIGRRMLDHLLDVARARGYRRVSIETGTMEAFAPARTLYASAGFVPCPPFAGYPTSPYSVCMALDLTTGVGDARAGARTRRGDRLLVASGSPFEATVGYSRAVRVGDRVEVAGTTALSADGVVPDDAADQARRCLEIIGDALTLAGASLVDVVRTRMYLTDAADFPAVGDVHGEVFGDVRPVATAVVVAGLVDPRLKVEIEVEAAVSAPAPPTPSTPPGR